MTSLLPRSPAATLLMILFAATPLRAENWIAATTANNIHCEVGDNPARASLVCHIKRRSGPLPAARPADCAFTWGHGYFITDTGPVRMLCMESWTHNWPGNGKFKPGTSSGFGDITCDATRNTLKCSNADGHGFFLSRRSQQIF
ncbi:hypothetical protein [Sulfitobacter aestuariivivens]|uniref:Uncharacterized protein n=1 Tax=Sulfitobacter aestuariivivens TaxID=2766981 RepID=A0A927D8A7_9RHOB|nr:hypothetical protein [Sulfitobacter aestuariivivens]MBD3665998.1 hypothetical protein [Sulfitobacter aestuariivivens]